MVPAGENLATSYPNATTRASYKIATENEFIGSAGIPPGTVNNFNRDLSKSGVMGEETTSAMQAKNPNDSTPLHSFYGDGTSLFADLASGTFKTTFNTNVLNFFSRWPGVNTLYIDNMLGSASWITHEGLVPQGYTSDADWRVRAAIPFINQLATAMRNAGIKTIFSLGDGADAALGEGPVDEHTGQTKIRFWGEIRAAGAVPDATFVEYWEQSPVDLSQYQLGEDAWNHRWLSHLGLPAAAHANGMDFHGLVYDNGGNIPEFAWATFLLVADLSRGDTLWINGNGHDPFARFPTLLYDLGGTALGAYTSTGNLYHRDYPSYTVIVNPSTADQTQTINGVSQTVPALSAKWVAANPPADWRTTPVRDNGASGLHPPTGWSGPLETGATDFTSVGGYDKPSSNAWAGMWRSDVAPWLTGQAYVDGGDQGNELWFRLQSTNLGTGPLVGYRITWWANGGSNLVQLWIRNAGDTVLAGSDVGGTSLGDTIGVNIDPATPNVFQVYRNNVLIFTHDITGDAVKITTAGRMGMYMSNDTATGMRNFGGGAVGNPPSNSVAPAVTGTARVGSVLTTTNGTWTDDGSPTFTRQWQRDNHGGGTYSNIPGATASTYTLVDADDGCKIRCVVTDTDGFGSTPANSNVTATITEPAPTNVTAPTVSGPTPAGSVLAVSNGTWTSMTGFNPTFTYQWTKGGVNISGATSANYTTQAGDVGAAIGCTVTATNSGGNASLASSNSITVTGAGAGFNPAVLATRHHHHH